MAAPASSSRAPRLSTAAFVAIVALSRLPLLAGGYGSDDDSWRNVVAATRMRLVGHYVPSRPPGFPVFESWLALIAPFGPWVTNGATALAGVIAALLFLRVARRLGVATPGWLALGFALSSGLWITTSQTMDYAYGLAFMLAAYLVLLDRRSLAAGVLLALATGCRVTLGAQLAGALLLLLARRESPRAWLALLGGFAGTLALVFAPVALSPELGDLRHEAAYHVAHAHMTLRTFGPDVRSALAFTFGRFGLAVLVLGAAATAWERLRPGRRARAAGAGAAFERGPIAYEWCGIVASAGFFVLVPYENAYLLPALPFALLLLARAMKPAWIRALAIVLMLEPLVTLSLGARRVVPGQLFAERAQRRADVAETQALVALSPGTPTVFVVGRFRVHRLVLLAPALERMGPAWKAFSGPGVALWRAGHRVGYAATLSGAQRDSLSHAGYAVEAWPPGAPPPTEGR